MWRKSLAQDLAEAAHTAAVGDEGTTPRERLLVLEDEHKLLSKRRRRLHESIDLLEGFETVKPDAAARLEKYKLTEREISRRRSELHREIGQLRFEQLWAGGGT
jgi:hypothetical protein